MTASARSRSSTAERDGALSFASELGALLADPESRARSTRRRSTRYLAYGYVPAPLSRLRGRRKLPPAHTLSARTASVAIERYWRLRLRPSERARRAGELDEQIREQLRAAVRGRLIADVPLGAFLSGGIDSSRSSPRWRRRRREPVKTFSIGFEEERYNELPLRPPVAERFGTDHHEFVVKPDAVEIAAEAGPPLRRAVRRLLGDPELLPRRDDPGAGHRRSQRRRRRRELRRLSPLPDSLVAPRSPRADGGGRAGRGRQRDCRSGTDLQEAGARDHRAACWWARRPDATSSATPSDASIFNAAEREALLEPDSSRRSAGSSGSGDIRGPLARGHRRRSSTPLLEVDVNTYLPGDLLLKIDIATMAHSLEARSPLLDPG